MECRGCFFFLFFIFIYFNKLPHIIACFELVKNNNAMVCDSSLGYNVLIKANTLCTSLYVDVAD